MSLTHLNKIFCLAILFNSLTWLFFFFGFYWWDNISRSNPWQKMLLLAIFRIKQASKQEKIPSFCSSVKIIIKNFLSFYSNFNSFIFSLFYFFSWLFNPNNPKWYMWHLVLLSFHPGFGFFLLFFSCFPWRFMQSPFAWKSE